MVLDLILEGPIGFDKPISLTSVRQKIATAGPFSAIHVQISSGGGEADEAFDIYTLLRAQPVPVCATATGECYSGGLIIFMAGALRKAKAGAGFLMHPTSSDRDDALPDRITAQILQRHADKLAKLDKRNVDLLVDRTGFNREWFEREISTEDPLNDTDAITSGI